MTDKNNDTWAEALGRIPSGLFIITARSGERETGMLASWVQQCSFDPPRISVAVHKGRYILDWLTPGTAFVVNVIPEGGKALIAHFGTGFEPGEPAFENIEVRREGEAPPILAAAHAYLECHVAAHFDAGDHVLVLGNVVAGSLLAEGKPITHTRKNGLKY